MLATSIIERGVMLSRDEIREEISGVLCRCTGYENIISAIHEYLQETVAAKTQPAAKELV